MKLKQLTEGVVVLESDRFPARPDEYGNEISMQQAAKNLVYVAMVKTRKMLSDMGAVKGAPTTKGVSDITPHTMTEPEEEGGIGKAYRQLRSAVRTKAQRDAQDLLSGRGSSRHIGEFWGFMVPSDWHDVEASQHGRPTQTGQFDKMVRTTVERSKNQPNEVKARNIAALANAI